VLLSLFDTGIVCVAGDMDEPESSWNAEQEADDGEDLMLLVHQVSDLAHAVLSMPF
jgi:hypothetical protein